MGLVVGLTGEMVHKVGLMITVVGGGLIVGLMGLMGLVSGVALIV